jgi:SAM-dependent methyltransferase
MRPVLAELQQKLQIRTVADVGCGVGYFSAFAREMGFDVSGFDGRAENLEEARRRNPAIDFQVADVEDPSLVQYGPYDLVLCPGLLYHLENPIRAVRNLSTIAGKILLIESFATPGTQTVFYLREESEAEDQGLRYLALIASESSLVKICYLSGFRAVYRFSPLPDHEDFREAPGRKRKRTMLLASRQPLDSRYLVYVPEPADISDPWLTPTGKVLTLPGRLKRYLKRKLFRRRVAERNAEVE